MCIRDGIPDIPDRLDFRSTLYVHWPLFTIIQLYPCLAGLHPRTMRRSQDSAFCWYWHEGENCFISSPINALFLAPLVQQWFSLGMYVFEASINVGGWRTAWRILALTEAGFESRVFCSLFNLQKCRFFNSCWAVILSAVRVLLLPWTCWTSETCPS